MKFKAYHKIKQFKDVVRAVNHKADFKGLNENNEPIYEASIKPILKFKGSVKLHGTNAMVYYTPEKGIMAGKRSSGLDPDQLAAHMGFNQFVQVTKKEDLTNILTSIHMKYCDSPLEQVILYGEWCGKGIQKGVAISELDKRFIVFDCKIYNTETEESKWLDIDTEPIKSLLMQYGIESITNFPTYSIEIDFNNPGLAQNKLIELTNTVEQECPVAKKLGVSGVGEGIVWETEWQGDRYIFKVKGEKHSSSKVKTLANVDPEILKSINEFVSYACTANRIKQGIKEINATEKKQMPDLLRWMANDIISEEDDVLKANNLEWKQVAKDIAHETRRYFFEKIDKL